LVFLELIININLQLHLIQLLLKRFHLYHLSQIKYWLISFYHIHARSHQMFGLFMIHQ